MHLGCIAAGTDRRRRKKEEENVHRRLSTIIARLYGFTADFTQSQSRSVRGGGLLFVC